MLLSFQIIHKLFLRMQNSRKAKLKMNLKSIKEEQKILIAEKIAESTFVIHENDDEIIGNRTQKKTKNLFCQNLIYESVRIKLI